MGTKTGSLWGLGLASFGFGAGSAVLKLMLRDFPDLQSIALVQMRLLLSGICLLALGCWQQRKLPAIRGKDVCALRRWAFSEFLWCSFF